MILKYFLHLRLKTAVFLFSLSKCNPLGTYCKRILVIGDIYKRSQARIFLCIFFPKRIFTLENATFRKIVLWMTTGPQVWQFSEGESGAEKVGGCVNAVLFTHQPSRIWEFIFIHLFSFIHLFRYILRVCHVQNTVLDSGIIAWNQTLSSASRPS